MCETPVKGASISYLKGDATKPVGDGTKIIAHITNDARRWGAGFVIALSHRWPKAEAAYRSGKDADLRLGNVQFVEVEPDVVVANMVAQHGTRTIGNTAPIRYESLRDCLEKVAGKAVELNASVHGPRFGAGLSGGKWGAIERIILDTVVANGIQVTIYDL